MPTGSEHPRSASARSASVWFPAKKPAAPDSSDARPRNAAENWHWRLGHVSARRLLEIRDKKLLIKTGIMLTVVILGFFLHPVIHMDPVWVAISGAIVIFALDNHHDLEE